MHYDLSNHTVLLTLLEQVSWDKIGGFSSVLYLSKLSNHSCVAEIRESNNCLTRKSWYSGEKRKKKRRKEKKVLLLGNFITRKLAYWNYTAAECFILFSDRAAVGLCPGSDEAPASSTDREKPQ